MKKYYLLSLLFTLTLSVSFLTQGKEKQKKEIKLLESKVLVVDIKNNQEVKSLISETKMLMEETCKLHHLLIKGKSNERRESNTRATERRDTHRGRNGVYCPASTGSHTVAK